MRIDLHVKSAPASECAFSTVGEILSGARTRKVKGVAFADFGLVRGAQTMGDLRVLADVVGIRVFSAISVMTTLGEMIVYGHVPFFDGRCDGVKEVAALVEWAHLAGAAVVWSDPMGWLCTRGQIGSDVSAGKYDWLLRQVDAFEIVWRSWRGHDEFVGGLASRFGKRVVFASGACHARHVGGTKGDFVIDEDIQNDEALVAWLRSSP